MHVMEVAEDTCIACDNNPAAPAKVRAFIYAKYQSGVTASFCAHHGHEHMAALLEKGAEILDLSHLAHG
ncbi:MULTISPECIES: hypothetical protein [unclassified Microbacterium]|uniref:DUF7455 domain-containing protein n=1 Tax=unclassified Microbacterium TaxID=2609290 RepID=UPI0011C3E38B|nr:MULTISPECIES: hypothetical protein [unclassified Microbacterium]MBT2485799.1 hypothetical protein [Microbacterium sp. ISL-108]